MRPHLAAAIALPIVPLRVTAQGNLGAYQDRIAVGGVMVR
jgi:hypothetical protein